MVKILVVEDDKGIAAGLAYSLREEGYEVVLVSRVRAAVDILSQEEFALALIDLGLPDGSGYEVCKAAKEKRDMPVVFLTACDDEVNVVMGLDMGADDYITKPFRIRELMSRLKSVLRRYGKSEAAKSVVRIGDVHIHMMEAKVYKKNQEVPLTAMEYRLLLTFCNNEGRVLTRTQLLEGIWDVAGDFVNDNTLTVYIKRLRDKLEDDPQDPRIIKTIRGLGYQLGG